MQELFHKWRRQMQAYDYDYYHQGALGSERGLQAPWVKKLIISVIILGLVYLGKQANWPLAKYVDQGVHYTVTVQYNYQDIWQGVTVWANALRSGDLSVLGRWLPFKKNGAPVAGGQLNESMIYPVDGKVISGYGWRVHPVFKDERLHEGIDLEGAEGTPIKSALSGQVEMVTESQTFGKTLIIDHGNGLKTRYAHCAEITVTPGQQVKQGQVVAKVGMTGITDGPHLHFEVLVNNQAIDPLTKLPKR